MRLLSDFRDEILARIQAESSALARGVATSFDEYRHRVGIINGLERSLKILEEVFKATPPEER